MIVLTTEVFVAGATAAQVSDFMINCDDRRYRQWWPEAHFRFHTVVRKPGTTGSLVYFDEMVGKRRLRFHAVITEFNPGRRIVWQMKTGFRLPAWLALDLEETPGVLRITHTLSAGFTGPGRALDYMIRLYLSPHFEEDLRQHAHTEFTKLAGLLEQQARRG